MIDVADMWKHHSFAINIVWLPWSTDRVAVMTISMYKFVDTIVFGPC